MGRINALYVRVSTDGQQTGLESQIRALKEWCFRNQINEYEIFADEGISGAKEDRPALNRLMKMVENNEVEQVIVFSFSRFARSTSHLLKGLKIFKEKNTRFISTTESIDTNSPLGVALYTILGALAQLEREMIIERVRAGMANAKAKGKRIGRVKKRNSVLIRSLIEAKLSYREIARISKCSHGSVHAEIVAFRKEKEAEEKQKLVDFQATLKSESSASTIEALKNANVSAESIQNYQQRIEDNAKIKVNEIQGTYYETFD
ncbi:MAG: recombinase family protein [Bdellovibrionaceae bacterium]|nr:recombinase family protein [Pseudobdellovibrionaceae bacterium]